ncbi:hypothetical protein [Streptomyces sp. MS1.AVA.4]|uniref:Uncharacterized protein n=1 Tax=Streptomyces pratisoli TaxID=3139917 RepID=A0ACC6Q932_9ACTN
MSSETTVEARLLDHLCAAGIRYTTPLDGAGTYVAVPLPDGSEIVISGTTTDRAEVRTRHAPQEHASWQATWQDYRTSRMRMLYDSHGEGREFEADTAAAAAAVVQAVREQTTHDGWTIVDWHTDDDGTVLLLRINDAWATRARAGRGDVDVFHADEPSARERFAELINL